MRCTENFQARAVRALALLACTLGCGGKVSAETDTAPEPSLAAPRAGPRFGAPTGSTGRPMPAPPMVGPAPVPPSEVPSAGMAALPRPGSSGGAFAIDGDTARAAVENVLAANCGSCHGPVADVAGSGGIRFIDDLDALVAAGLIVPLNSAGSRIIQVMVDGSMPPASAGYQVTYADIGTVASYIDNPRYWADVSPPAVVDAGVGSPPPPPALLDAGAPPVAEPGAPPVAEPGAPPAAEPGADGGAGPLPTDE